MASAQLPQFKGRPGWEFTDLTGLDLTAYEPVSAAEPEVTAWGEPLFDLGEPGADVGQPCGTDVRTGPLEGVRGALDGLAVTLTEQADQLGGTLPAHDQVLPADFGQ